MKLTPHIGAMHRQLQDICISHIQELYRQEEKENPGHFEKEGVRQFGNGRQFDLTAEEETVMGFKEAQVVLRSGQLRSVYSLHTDELVQLMMNVEQELGA